MWRINVWRCIDVSSRYWWNILKKEGYEKSSDKIDIMKIWYYILDYIYIYGDYTYIERWFFIFL